MTSRGRDGYTREMDDFLDYVHALRAEYHSLKTLAERAAAQLDDEQFFALLDPEANSVAMLMKHLGGNLRSRWRDFRTTDGEKPDRLRDSEFEIRESRVDIEQRWAEGWGVLLDALDGMTGQDRTVQIVIRGESASLPRALARNLSHVAGHVHQIVMLAKHWKGSGWETLSIPRGASERARTSSASPATDQSR